MLKRLLQIAELLKRLKKGRKPVSKGLTKAQRATLLYNRRDLYLKELDKIIESNPEKYNRKMSNTYDMYEEAHKEFQEGLKNGTISLSPENEWMRGIAYDRLHGGTSMEVFMPYDDIQSITDEIWLTNSDFQRNPFVGRSNWENMQR